jgi:hypothetical protein
MNDISLTAASSFVLQFDDKMQAEISTAMKRLQAAIVHLDRVMAADIDTNDVVRVFYKTRLLHDALEETRKRLTEKIKRLSEYTIPMRFEADKQKTVTLTDVGRVTVNYRVSASLTDKEAGFKWLRKAKQGDLIQETVNAQTLGAFCNEQFIQANKEPPDCIKVSVNPYTSITKV